MENNDANGGIQGQKTRREMKSPISADWATVWVGVIGIPLLAYQSCQTSESLKLTRESNQMTRESIDFSKEISQAGDRDTADQLAETRKAVETSKEASMAATRLADAAEASTRAASTAMRHDLRPWLVYKGDGKL